MRLELPELVEPLTVILSAEGRLSDDDYMAFCEANPDLDLERSAEGAIIVVPPAGFESSFRNGDACGQLRDWARKTKTGKVTDSSGQFFLRNGAARAPDASWTSKARMKTVDKKELRKFPHFCPEFVIEVMSPSDRLKAAQKKMQDWVTNGAELGWLIDGDARTVYIYRPGKPVEARTDISEIAGESPVEGFVLDLDDIWEGA
jgi:Uma2 family endonuclease